MTVQEARDYFRQHYAYIHIEDVDDEIIEDFLQRRNRMGYTKEVLMDLLQDRLLSQGECDVTP